MDQPKHAEGRSLHRFLLIFSDASLEAAYLKSQRQALLKSSSVAVAALAFLTLLSLCIDAQRDYYPGHQSFRLFHFSSSASLLWHFNALGFIWSAFILLVFIKGRSRISCVTVEIIVIITSVMGTVMACLADGYRSKILLGHRREFAYHYTDSNLLLNLDLYITAVLLFIPLRSCIAWLVPWIACSSYILSTTFCGGPEMDSSWVRGVRLCIQLFLLGGFAWWGRYRSEQASRRDFLKQQELAQTVDTERSLKVAERVMRYDAERELGQCKGTWQPTSSGSQPTTHAGADQARANGNRRGTSSRSNTSGDISSLQSGRAKYRASRQADDDFWITPAESVEAAVENLLRSFISTGQCCARHAALFTLDCTLKRIKCKPCDPGIGQAHYFNKQCINCKMMQPLDDAECNLCRDDLFWNPQSSQCMGCKAMVQDGLNACHNCGHDQFWRHMQIESRLSL
eukprot:gnl/MRDRNA2_/MRDRNA2_53989_c0_seq2.p1 gnl/MRDRNA2_/MRDRNA2_53989_c0~~gnl/MRDRNA2_/MRDRNA2_53989_c0_seq2.p1  ORF type:complete len:456 (-),score=25.90 gnl/MRDRNA2_/MRDRNA2_53989_c0_seq2:860-2227(-)